MASLESLRSISCWLALGVVAGAASLPAQMVTGTKMPGYATTFGLKENPDAAKPRKEGAPILTSLAPTDIDVRELSVETPSATMVNVLLDGEQARLTLHVTNKSKDDIRGTATMRIVRYGTSVPEGDIWVPRVFKINDAGSFPVPLDIPKGASVDVTVAPVLPAQYGGYGLVLDTPGHDSVFAATLARVVTPEPGRVQFPTYALDVDWPNNMNEGVYTLMEKLGIKGVRLGAGFNIPSEKSYAVEQANLERSMAWAKKHNVTVMMTIGAGAGNSPIQPLGQPRPHLDADGRMMKTKSDMAWLPQYDDEFEQWVHKLGDDYGWPKGNLNAVELWNEPWEGISISGWGADIERYRDIYTHMANGILAARKDAGVKVLIGGTSSSANARDKLFSDGTDTFLPIFDFVSIHYQALAADPTLETKWVTRKSDYGPVKVWDTESWIANSDDRVAGVIASMRAQGQSRTAGVFRGNVYDSSNFKLKGAVYPVVQAYPVAAAIGATQRFIGQRAFREILFRNGLPWVFVFDGLTEEASGAKHPDDGTIVIVGNLAKIYPPGRTLFRSVGVDAKASMSVPDLGGIVRMFDFYGNPLNSQDGIYKVPLNGLGFFLRSDGTPGSFAKLVEAVRAAKTYGIDPVQIVAKDMTTPIQNQPRVRVELTNVLNRPVTGKLTVAMENLQVSDVPALTLKPNETREVALSIVGKSDSSNTYPLKAKFDAGLDGTATHEEKMHVNLIAHKTITVDGDLADWNGVLPQVLGAPAIGESQTEQAYLPFEAAGAGGAGSASTVWLAYDDKNFYFAAKIPDTTPDEGMVRFATRDDNAYFYPGHVTTMDGKGLDWPAGVRHYSYRTNFDVPSGNSKHDNVQIAFNVLEKKPWLPFPAGTEPHFITYWDTDYEYALNPVAQKYGGGSELWRLSAPGVPMKSYFPRTPRSALDQGPVKGGQLVSTRVGDVRVVEAAIPWTEMPDVWKRVQARETVKFTCRVSDNGGKPRELATERSVSKDNARTFHDSWATHWSNELEFGIAR